MIDDQTMQGSSSIKEPGVEARRGEPWYALEKLQCAVWKLATGAEGIKARLADAYVELAVIQEADLPPGVLEGWRAIRSDLTQGRMQYETRLEGGQLVKKPIGLLYSTLRFMRKERATDIARRICDLESQLAVYLEENDPHAA